MKVPSGYSSNIQGRINMKEKKFTNLKSQDCPLEERVASIEGALAASHQQQEAPSVPNMESSPGSQCRNNIASTELPAGD
jgi:hypothetical protein